MKQTLFAFLFSFSIFSAFAQAPEKINYQGVARNANGDVIPNQVLGLRISLRSGSNSGTIVYQETHSIPTNQFGLFNVEIGGGLVVGSYVFSNINWGSNTYYVQSEMDVTGGTTYVNMGTQQLISVPYALYAKSSGSSLQGPTGPTGATGLTGATGATGPTGPSTPDVGCIIQATSWTDCLNFFCTAATYTATGTFEDTKLVNIGSAFNTSNGIFTAPVSGFYNVSLRVRGFTEGQRLVLFGDRNGTSGGEIYDGTITSASNPTGGEDYMFSMMIYLDQGDTHRILKRDTGTGIDTMIIGYRLL